LAERLEGDEPEVFVGRDERHGQRVGVQLRQLVVAGEPQEADAGVARRALLELVAERAGAGDAQLDVAGHVGHRVDEQVEALGPVEARRGEQVAAVLVVARRRGEVARGG
jgi:hypothetical protein